MNGFEMAELGGVARDVPCAVIVAPVGGVVAGLRQAEPGDALDGLQVVALAGIVAQQGGRWDGVICLTGARSAWVHVSAGEAVSFASFVSGRVAEALGAGGQEGFAEGVDAVMSRPERLAGELARAEAAPGRAWGALVGAELAATRPYWLGQQVIVVGDRSYAEALKAQGVPVAVTDWARAVETGEAAIKGAMA